MVRVPSGLATCLLKFLARTMGAALSDGMMLKRLLPFLLLSLFMIDAAAAPPSTLLVVGDSLSAGHGIDQGQGWVSLLSQRLAAQGYDYRVVNASISGDTTSGGRARLPAALARHQPAVVVLELGGNDGLRGLSLEEMRANLDAMIVAARRAGARVLLLGVPMPPNYGAYGTRFQAVFRELAAEHQVALVPDLLADVAARRALMQADGIHPTDEAQAAMLQNVWPRLQPLL